MNPSPRVLGALLLLAGIASSVLGADRTIKIFEGRQVTVTVPDGWRFRESAEAVTGVQTVTVYDPSGQIKVQLSFFSDFANRLGSKSAVEAEMKTAFGKMLDGAVEREMKNAFTETPDGFEGHTVFTDRQFVGKPVPKDQRRLATVGILSWQGAFGVFTVLSNESESETYKNALNLIRSVAMSAAASANDRIVIAEHESVYELTIPVSGLTMSIPKVGLSQKSTDPSAGRRYFYFEDAKKHLNLSGWFEPQEEFPGMTKFWQSETSAWARNKLPKPEDVSFRKIGSWETVTYQIPTPIGSNSHIRAHWLEAGTWIDLHLSVTSDATRQQNVALLESLLARIQVVRK